MPGPYPSHSIPFHSIHFLLLSLHLSPSRFLIELLHRLLQYHNGALRKDVRLGLALDSVVGLVITPVVISTITTDNANVNVASRAKILEDTAADRLVDQCHRFGF
eukprot:NODE_6349_length_579_cov_35.673585_g5936_i0.p1 GENE.NODE_6349_length_579_cov_35.673585_g5936_i0~~NODE_6349_length_579_cov_35.673585_g5936_i0.p1  ORF type:complete len:105 (+),score=10.32 NODE_6349_length_579_cov_35.673585_g5936_i0:240-554(+)